MSASNDDFSKDENIVSNQNIEGDGAGAMANDELIFEDLSDSEISFSEYEKKALDDDNDEDNKEIDDLMRELSPGMMKEVNEITAEEEEEDEELMRKLKQLQESTMDVSETLAEVKAEEWEGVEEQEEQMPLDGDFYPHYPLEDLPDTWLYREDHFNLHTTPISALTPSNQDVQSPDSTFEDNAAAFLRPMLMAEHDAVDASAQEMEQELLLLHSSHPQMQRFQTSMKAHYEKKIEETQARIRAASLRLNQARQNKQQLSLKLSLLQQDLEKAEASTQKQRDEYTSIQKDKQQLEGDLETLRATKEAKKKEEECQRRVLKDLKTKINNTSLMAMFLERMYDETAEETSKAKIHVVKTKEIAKRTEEDQIRNDLWLTRLSQKKQEIEEQLWQTENNLRAHHADVCTINHVASEALVELEAVRLATKALQSLWTCELATNQKKDDLHVTVEEENKKAVNTLKNEKQALEKLKRTLLHQQERNSLLTLSIKRCQYSIKALVRSMETKGKLQQELQQKFDTFAAVLKQNSEMLAQASAQNEQINLKRLKLKKIYDKRLMQKNAIREDMAAKMSESLMDGNVLEKLMKQLLQVQKSTVVLRLQITTKENNIAHMMRRLMHKQLLNEALNKLLGRLGRQVQAKQTNLDVNVAETARIDSLIHNKNAQMLLLYKKIDHLLEKTGGVHVNPYELQLLNLKDEIARQSKQITELKKVWLADQAKLIRTTKRLDEERTAMVDAQREISLLYTKHIRIKGNINREQADVNDLQRQLKATQRKISNLNIEIGKTRNDKDMCLGEKKFLLHYLDVYVKEEQRAYMEMQREYNGVLQAKDDRVEELLEIEKQILLWERKVHVAREMRATFMTLSWVDEVSAMRNELWRMEMRGGVLLREIEKVQRLLEKIAVKTVDLLSVDENSTKAKQKTLLSRHINDLRAKLKLNKTTLKSLDKELAEMQKVDKELLAEASEREVAVNGMWMLEETMRKDLHRYNPLLSWKIKETLVAQHACRDLQAAGENNKRKSSLNSVNQQLRSLLVEVERMFKIIPELTAHFPEEKEEVDCVVDILRSPLFLLLKKEVSTQSQNASTLEITA